MNQKKTEWRGWAVALALAACLGLVAGPVLAQDQASADAAEPAVSEQPAETAAPADEVEEPDTAEVIDTSRLQLEKWVETQRVISKEREAWKLAKELLNERVGLVEGEIESTRGTIDEARKNLKETDAVYEEKSTEEAKLKSASASLVATVGDMERQTRELLKKFPVPLQDKLQALSQQLPDDPDNTDIPISRRYQNVIAILDQANRFNREITVIPHAVKPEGGDKEVTATVMYIGLGKAYFVYGELREFGGIGTPGDNGWVWTQTDELAADIGLVLDIYSNKEVPAYVSLPMDVQ